jgi:hypothetical protein
VSQQTITTKPTKKVITVGINRQQPQSTSEVKSGIPQWVIGNEDKPNFLQTYNVYVLREEHAQQKLQPNKNTFNPICTLGKESYAYIFIGTVTAANMADALEQALDKTHYFTYVDKSKEFLCAMD